MSRLILLFLMLIALSGCKTYDLGPEWEPLEQIVETPWENDKIVTWSPSVYTDSIDDFLDNNPPNSGSFLGRMMHEQVHAKRQEWIPIIGKYLWGIYYATVPGAMWDEERLGWFVQLKVFIKYNVEGGLHNQIKFAKLMSRYIGLWGKMISYADALQWIKDVTYGGWTLPEEDWEWLEENLPRVYEEIKDV